MTYDDLYQHFAIEYQCTVPGAMIPQKFGYIDLLLLFFKVFNNLKISESIIYLLPNYPLIRNISFVLKSTNTNKIPRFEEESSKNKETFFGTVCNSEEVIAHFHKH